MKKLVMVDLWTDVDENGNPVGHGVKVGREYYEYVKERFDVVQYVGEKVTACFSNPSIRALPYYVSMKDRKHVRLWNNIRNIRYLCRQYRDGLFWFYVPDFYTYLAVFLSGMAKRSVFIAFEDYGANRLKHRIFTNIMRNSAGSIVTNRKLFEENYPGAIYLTDYAYDRAKYERYGKSEKKDCVVCLGTMNSRKMLEEAVHAFNRTGYELRICGKFTDSEYYHLLCSIASVNVTIENRYIDEEEYYTLIGESRFCLIPYDINLYKNRTSGVLQEAMFLDTIPISHEEILKFNDIPGVGYQMMADLGNMDLGNLSLNEMYERYREKRNTEYSVDEIKHRLNMFLTEIVG